MIEVQLLLTGKEDSNLLALCEAGLVSPLVNVHKGNDITNNTNAARISIWDNCGGNLLSYVESQDIPDPKAWKLFQETFDNNPKISGVYTLEKHIRSNGSEMFLQPDSSNLDPLFGRKYVRHILTVKREVYEICKPYIETVPYGVEWFLAIAAYRMGGLICIPQRLYQWRYNNDLELNDFNHNSNMGLDFAKWLTKNEAYINYIKNK